MLRNKEMICCSVWVGNLVLTMREEDRLRTVQNSVLRKTFGTKREEVTQEWRRLHSGELHDIHSKLNIVRVS